MNDFTESKHIGIARIREEARLRYNPLRNLTPQRITQAMDNFHCGYLGDAAKIYDAIRRRDAIVQACVQKRKRATSRLAWTIVEMGDDEVASAQQSAFLEDFFNNITVSSAADANKRGSMSMLIEHILSALENKYAVSEIIWNPTAAPNLSAEVRSVPLWFFENTEGYLRFKKSSYDTEGVPLEKNGWMVSVADSALMEATAVCYIVKRYAQNDWAVCSQRFGMPTPVYTSSAARGSDLSTLSAENNTGASLQAEESEILEDADCALVEETIAHYLSVPALEWRFGKGVKPAAYLQLTRKNRKDKLNQLAVYKGAAELGCPVAKRDVYESLELREPEEGEDTVELSASAMGGAPMSFANSQSGEDEIGAMLDKLAAAKAKDIEPLLKRFDELGKITDASEYADALQKLYDDVLKLSNGGENEAAAMDQFLKDGIENGQK